ncbi:MAG: YfjI family protein [Proteobacteria bacterium]|nr:YfjI family protein [Pseudomonadota bacterium]
MSEAIKLWDEPETSSSDWPPPQPLSVKVAARPYPCDALPQTLRAAIDEVQSFVQAPYPLVASSALGALSTACQTLVDVQRAQRLIGPCSLYLLAIADSGERKTSCDNYFIKAISDWQKAQEEAAKPELKLYKVEYTEWEAKRETVTLQIGKQSKQGKDLGALRAELLDVEQREPHAPRVPRLLLSDETPESLAWSLAHRWPSASIISSEAGVVLGSHGMSKDSAMRNLTMLNVLWDGGELRIGRKTTDSFTVRGARVTMSLQVQEAALREFFGKTGALARGTGFLARFLLSWPESAQGRRFFREAPKDWPKLEAFERRITVILNAPVAIDEGGALVLPVLHMAQEAHAAWVRFHDEVESMLAEGGELHDVRDFASKAADNVARLAALFHVFEGKVGAIGAGCVMSARRVVAWHLNETLRFFGELALCPELADAVRLDSWLVRYCLRERTHLVAKSVAMQFGPLRTKNRLDEAIRELVELDRLQVRQEGKRTWLAVNPAVMGGVP